MSILVAEFCGITHRFQCLRWNELTTENHFSTLPICSFSYYHYLSEFRSSNWIYFSIHHLSWCKINLQQKPAAKPAAAASGSAPRFEIKKWNAVAMWSWDICADTVSSKSNSMTYRLFNVVAPPPVDSQWSCLILNLLPCDVHFSPFMSTARFSFVFSSKCTAARTTRGKKTQHNTT